MNKLYGQRDKHYFLVKYSVAVSTTHCTKYALRRNVDSETSERRRNGIAGKFN